MRNHCVGTVLRRAQQQLSQNVTSLDTLKRVAENVRDVQQLIVCLCLKLAFDESPMVGNKRIKQIHVNPGLYPLGGVSPGHAAMAPRF